MPASVSFSMLHIDVLHIVGRLVAVYRGIDQRVVDERNGLLGARIPGSRVIGELAVEVRHSRPAYW